MGSCSCHERQEKPPSWAAPSTNPGEVWEGRNKRGGRDHLHFSGWATKQKLLEQQSRGMKSSLQTSSKLQSGPGAAPSQHFPSRAQNHGDPGKHLHSNGAENRHVHQQVPGSDLDLNVLLASASSPQTAQPPSSSLASVGVTSTHTQESQVCSPFNPQVSGRCSVPLRDSKHRYQYQPQKSDDHSRTRP